MTREEAIKEIKSWDFLLEKEIEAIKTLIPELRESEDERIIKTLIDALKTSKTVGELKFILPEATREECITYLEKQKEQKEIPLMNGDAELYFDDWNQQKQNPTKRQCFEEGIRYAQRLQKEQKPVSNDGQQECPYKDLVLVKNFFGEYKRKCVLSGEACEPNECKNNKTVQLGGTFTSYDMAKSFIEGQDYVLKHPEKFNLCTSAEWSEEDRKMIDHLIEVLPMWATGQIAMLPSQAEEYVKRLKSLRPQIIDSTPLYTIEQVDEKIQEAQEWGDEDKKILESLISLIETISEYYISLETRNGYVAWLKDLKERFNSLPKQEWSEEEKKIIRYIRHLIFEHAFENGGVDVNGDYCKDIYQKADDFLKSLRPKQKYGWRRYIWAVNLCFDYDGLVRYEDNDSYEIVTAGNKPKRQVNGEYILLKDIQSVDWKPSEEQMNSLRDTIVQTKGYSYSMYLPELYEQLKKLI